MINFSETNDSLIFTVRVMPRSSKSEIVGEAGGALKVRISAPPIDGAANAQLVKLLSKTFNVSKSAVEILSGETSKTKKVEIKNARGAKLAEILNLK